MLTQATSITFVRVDMLVNRFMADLQSAFQPKPISSLFRTEVFPDQPLYFGPCFR